MSISIQNWGNKKPSNGLAAITKYLEVELGEKHHTADADAQATGLVMSAIINGAIERDWPTNLLDSEKRKTKLQKDNEKFDAEINKFRAAKEEFNYEPYFAPCWFRERRKSGRSRRHIRPICLHSWNQS
mgnify:CR=1 FL=1